MCPAEDLRQHPHLQEDSFLRAVQKGGGNRAQRAKNEGGWWAQGFLCSLGKSETPVTDGRAW